MFPPHPAVDQVHASQEGSLPRIHDVTPGTVTGGISTSEISLGVSGPLFMRSE